MYTKLHDLHTLHDLLHDLGDSRLAHSVAMFYILHDLHDLLDYLHKRARFRTGRTPCKACRLRIKVSAKGCAGRAAGHQSRILPRVLLHDLGHAVGHAAAQRGRRPTVMPKDPAVRRARAQCKQQQRRKWRFLKLPSRETPLAAWSNQPKKERNDHVEQEETETTQKRVAGGA